MSAPNVLDRVKKLLRLSTSSNANEAALAAAKAQELIDAHQLDQALLTLDGQEPAEHEEDIEDFQRKDAPLAGTPGGRVMRWQWALADTVMRANACRGYVDSGRIAIVGRPSDVETVRYLHGWLFRELERLTERDGRGAGTVWRNNYRLGVVDTIRNGLWAQRKASAAHAKTGQSGAALVRIDRALARVEERGRDVERFVKSELHLVYRSQSAAIKDPTARALGREAGKAIDLTQRSSGALGTSRRALAQGGAR